MICKIFRRVAAKAKRTVELISAKARVRAASIHLSGPRKIKLDEDEVALVCMLKNGSYYLDELLEHHRNIGIHHFLFIDNGSEDNTIKYLMSQPDVTVISNRLPVRIYESFMRADIAQRVIKGGWFLFLDSDELIEMINGKDKSIQAYARYCNEYGYDAVVGQSLDLFSTRPFSETEGWSYKQTISEFNQFSLRFISDLDYHDKTVGFAWFLQENTVSNPSIRLKFGGIRCELFNENCALTNHRMVRNAKHIWIYSHPHCSSYVHCADFTLLIRHYKFAGNYIQREQKQMRNKIWDHGEDQSRLSIITDPGFNFTGKEIQQFSGTGNLLDQGFLTGSTAFFARFPDPDSPVPQDLV